MYVERTRYATNDVAPWSGVERERGEGENTTEVNGGPEEFHFQVGEQWVPVAEHPFLPRPPKSQKPTSSVESLTQSPHSHSARSRKPYHPTVSTGCVLTGVWVVAHECGHHAFSDYQWLDDTVGLILHSALLVPYFSWKHSHRRHHSNTASMERDEVFVPKPKSEIRWYAKYLNNPPGRIFTVLVTLTLGWPLYLMFNVSGRKYDRFACHYDPYGPIYSNRERAQIYLSDAGNLAMGLVLYKLAAAKGLTWVLCMYGVPLLIVNGFLVLITWLQHTHPAVPHYDSSEWDWLRGALSTVDRDYGILNKVFHNITDTHVAHHLFSTMPHYHAMEATKAIRPILGDYYQYDGTPLLKAIWREAKECVYVEPDNGGQKGVFCQSYRETGGCSRHYGMCFAAAKINTEKKGISSREDDEDTVEEASEKVKLAGGDTDSKSAMEAKHGAFSGQRFLDLSKPLILRGKLMGRTNSDGPLRPSLGSTWTGAIVGVTVHPCSDIF
ncbi:hypothetical protein Vadar_015715 [Vaccinium darrowii]|uniref:Uncharacterized protein n=1 Tax=Vaccinium darrowii TaxID=229202 RepID=A0ACB7XQW8_9ERIC|nr:hypothetical protein Vadar_015715 [Vaccinium darrowii]